jgi:hypothetical protein
MTMDVTGNGVPIEEVVGAVKNAITLAGISAADSGRDLRVTEIRLSLHTVAALTAGGGVDFRVPFLGMRLTMGRAITRRDTHTIGIVLEPPDLSGRHEIRDGDVEGVLLDAIETVRAVLVRAADGDDPFRLRESTVELSFAITKDGSITLGFNGEFKDEIAHTLRIGLGPGA